MEYNEQRGKKSNITRKQFATYLEDALLFVGWEYFFYCMAALTTMTLFYVSGLGL